MILDEIVSNKLKEIAASKKRLPLREIERQVSLQPPPLDFHRALKGDRVRLIAEVKKASPSKGVIRKDFDPVAISRAYARNGAAAISVLTDERYFQGRLEYLPRIKQALGLDAVPLLRKDFILDPYQVCESRAAGADAILLIVAILKPARLRSLLSLARRLGMACLAEVHNERELDLAQQTDARIIGINNRDLATMTVDINTTVRLRPLILPGRIVVSESGIRARADVELMEGLGVNAVLVGEALMASGDIAASMKELLGKG
jgi:indole-3-glycerol phosphate synthase